MTDDERLAAAALEHAEAPSAEVAEARRREFIADVQQRPGFNAALAEVARLEQAGIAEEIAAARSTLPRMEPSPSAAASGTPAEATTPSARGQTLKKGLRAVPMKTARSLRSVLEEQDARRAAAALAQSEVSPRRSWLLIGLGMGALVGLIVWTLLTIRGEHANVASPGATSVASAGFASTGFASTATTSIDSSPTSQPAGSASEASATRPATARADVSSAKPVASAKPTSATSTTAVPVPTNSSTPPAMVSSAPAASTSSSTKSGLPYFDARNHP